MRDHTGRYSLSRIAILAMMAALPSVVFADQAAPPAIVPPVTPAVTNAPAAPVAPAALPTGLYALTTHSIDGKPVDLGQYMGHVALVVNTASKCAYADQFVGLEKLYQNYKDQGFVVLDFPSNDFGQLEKGTPEETATTYALFKVTFPVFEIVRTRGDGQSPVYQFLTTGHSEPTWNFHKYLVDKAGKVIAEFPSQTKPDDKDLQTAIEAALK